MSGWKKMQSSFQALLIQKLIDLIILSRDVGLRLLTKGRHVGLPLRFNGGRFIYIFAAWNSMH